MSFLSVWPYLFSLCSINLSPFQIGVLGWLNSFIISTDVVNMQAVDVSHMFCLGV